MLAKLSKIWMHINNVFHQCKLRSIYLTEANWYIKCDGTFEILDFFLLLEKDY